MIKLDVLCIDGVMGVGKTTQAIIFHNLLKSNNIPHKIFSFVETDDISYTKNLLLKIDKYLIKEPDGIVICDGSIAIDIVEDISQSMHKDKIWLKHKDNIHLYDSLNSKYSFVNVLITPNNVDLCDERLEKRHKVDKLIYNKIENIEHQKLLIKGLRDFDNNMLTYNINFQNILLDGSETITDIHNEITNIIKKKNYIKKPS